MRKPQILLTNDDGSQSPGLWAAAQALSDQAEVTIVAPRAQSSGMGRGMPSNSDGIIRLERVRAQAREWEIYAVGGSPAQAVQHGLLEIMPQRPDLVVAGINYGENVGTSIFISGTIGAAMEAVSLGIPALAVSLETEQEHHFSHSKEVDFSTAAHFTADFARRLLHGELPNDILFLKVDIPSSATRQTAWQITRLSQQPYFVPVKARRESWDKPGRIHYHVEVSLNDEPTDSDVYVLRVKRLVSVTPLSLDCTARVDLSQLEQALRCA